MLFAALLSIGAGFGLAIGALGHPKIYAALIGGRVESGDVEDQIRL